ncbi:HNH endonuclease [Porphyrobacter sp. GA68]|uniref:HNH endonuclease n=1 Tax=Porphyrobacter sp. GA68 TaxID=2883480 RepID=UPI001D185849|nr:HNH endonuclease [Porphyrobacter sp. GA68]
MVEEPDLICWLCERPLGESVQWHHPVPKAKKGKVKVPVHPICHKTIHKLFTNAQLARTGQDRASLLKDDELAKFINWIKTKPSDFDAPVR